MSSEHKDSVVGGLAMMVGGAGMVFRCFVGAAAGAAGTIAGTVAGAAVVLCCKQLVSDEEVELDEFDDPVVVDHADATESPVISNTMLPEPDVAPSVIGDNMSLENAINDLSEDRGKAGHAEPLPDVAPSK